MGAVMKLMFVRIHTEFLLDWMTNGKTHLFKVTNGLPQGTKFCYTIHDDFYAFKIVVSHDSFPELKDGEIIPEFKRIEFWKLGVADIK